MKRLNNVKVEMNDYLKYNKFRSSKKVIYFF